MRMPTMEQVEAADHQETCRLYRFLPSPGASDIDKPAAEFHKIVEAEKKIIRRVAERFKEFGGMTPAISKSIGWEG